MQLAEENDFPAFALDGAVEVRPLRATPEQTLDPLPPEGAPQEKRPSRAEHIPEAYECEAPPQPKEKASAHTQNAARQEQEIACRDDRRIRYRRGQSHPGNPTLKVGERPRDRDIVDDCHTHKHHQGNTGKLVRDGAERIFRHGKSCPLIQEPRCPPRAFFRKNLFGITSPADLSVAIWKARCRSARCRLKYATTRQVNFAAADCANGERTCRVA